MKEPMQWIKSYPLLTLMIISCLIGAPYFGGQRIYEQQKKYTEKIQFQDVLAEVPVFTSDVTDLKVNGQNTEEQRLATIEKEKRGPFSDVDSSYLDDAVFIGDSRTDTLQLYAGWDNTTYYVKTGTNIWSIMDDKVVKDPKSGKDISIDEGLQKTQFKKVYIMLGVNELGTGTAETYYQQFKKVVARIRELQPEAIIFVQSIIHVSAEKDAEGTVINNKEINARNKLLKKLADNKMIFYLDANEVLDDDTGALTGKYTFDGVHLQAEYVGIWKDYLMSHGVVPETVEK